MMRLVILTNDSIHSYGFDGENKTKSVDGVNDVYRYDGDGNRVRKNFALGDQLRMVYSGGQLIAEYDLSTGSLKREYVYAAKGLVATIEPSTGTRYATVDSLGSPRVITNSTGGVVSRHDLMPFGEELAAGTGGRTNAMGYSVADGLRQRYTQKERDDETGLDYFGARYYGSQQGRFTGSDPKFGASNRPETWNAYTYASNNPLNRIDPDGARDIPAYVRTYVFTNLRSMFQTALAADVSVGGVFAIGALETQWGTTYAYKHKHNPAGMSVKEVPLSYASLDEGYSVFVDLLCGRFDRVVGVHDPRQFIDTIENDNGPKWNSVNPDYVNIVKNGILLGFGLDFFDESVLSLLRNGRDVKFNGVTVSSVAELDKLMNSDQPGDQQMIGRFFAGVYQGWLDYVRNIGTERDPNVQKIGAAFDLPGSNPIAEEEALYEYRVGRAFSGR